jgi:hypothetical protein
MAEGDGDLLQAGSGPVAPTHGEIPLKCYFIYGDRKIIIYGDRKIIIDCC